MKRIILSALFVCTSVFAGSDPEKDFVSIPANPGFAFARDLQSRGPRGNAGEKSPIAKPYRLAKYPVTNAEYSAFCKDTGHPATGGTEISRKARRIILCWKCPWTM